MSEVVRVIPLTPHPVPVEELAQELEMAMLDHGRATLVVQVVDNSLLLVRQIPKGEGA
jgi:membrane-bound inhibitor of C-type lysozyme